MHEVDLGKPVPDAELVNLISMHGKDAITLGILQWLRNKTALLDKTGRQVPVGADPHDYRAYHGGAGDALEEVFWDIYKATQTELDKELEEGE